jgi:hypothetical protein
MANRSEQRPVKARERMVRIPTGVERAGDDPTDPGTVVFKIPAKNAARQRPRQPGRWRQGAVLLAIIILVSLAVLAAADTWMIIKDGSQRCGTQFPKWLGCVVANHESLSGSLITAGGAIFAAWVAWHAVMDQIDSAVRPLANIRVGDYENHVFVEVVNNGTGPMIIKSITINNSPQPLHIALWEVLPEGIRWRHFTGDCADLSVPAGGKIVLVDLSSRTYTGVDEGKFAAARELVRQALGNITVRVKYTDMYNKNQSAAERTLDWFHRANPRLVPSS